MRVFTVALSILFAQPALADQSRFDIDFPTCLGALRDAALQLRLPLHFTVNTPDRKDFAIATSGGLVTMSCDRVAGTLTVFTPPGQSILPYISGGSSDVGE